MKVQAKMCLDARTQNVSSMGEVGEGAGQKFCLSSTYFTEVRGCPFRAVFLRKPLPSLQIRGATIGPMIYSKACLKWPLKNRQNKCLKDKG